MKVATDIDARIETQVEDLGFEVVEVRWGGSSRRPILKLRIDRPDAVPGSGGVTVDECAKISRALEAWMDEHPAFPERYVLEVSSPGVERPLVRGRDFTRFRGERIAVSGKDALAGRATRLEGELLGLDGEGTDDEAVRLRLTSGEEVAVPRTEIRKAHLVFTWK